MVAFRRLLIFIICAILIIMFVSIQKGNLSDISFDNNCTYYLYLNHKNFTATNDEIAVIENANGLIIKTKFKYANAVKNSTFGIMGEAIEIEKNIDISAILNKLKATKISNENVLNKNVILAYSYVLNDFINVNDKRVNLQVAIGENSTIIGYPLILHSF